MGALFMVQVRIMEEPAVLLRSLPLSYCKCYPPSQMGHVHDVYRHRVARLWLAVGLTLLQHLAGRVFFVVGYDVHVMY